MSLIPWIFLYKATHQKTVTKKTKDNKPTKPAYKPKEYSLEKMLERKRYGGWNMTDFDHTVLYLVGKNEQISDIVYKWSEQFSHLREFDDNHLTNLMEMYAESCDEYQALRSRSLLINGYYNKYSESQNLQYQEYVNSLFNKITESAPKEEKELMAEFIVQTVDTLMNMNQEDFRKANSCHPPMNVDCHKIEPSLFHSISDLVNKEVSQQLKESENQKSIDNTDDLSK